MSVPRNGGRRPGGRRALLAVALSVGTACGGDAPVEARFPAPGSRTPGFHLPELLLRAPWVESDSIRLSDLEGSFVYLDVFGSWCLPCRQRHPQTVQIADTLRSQGAHVLGLLLEDRPESAARWLRDQGASYPFVVVDGPTARAWGLVGAPMGFLLSPEGEVIRACHGCARGEHAIERLPEEVRRLRSGIR